MEDVSRKTAIAIWVGSRDPYFPLEAVRDTLDALKARGFQVQLFEMSGHDHNYYAVSRDVNKHVSEFLRTTELTSDPKRKQYSTRYRRPYSRLPSANRQL